MISTTQDFQPFWSLLRERAPLLARVTFAGDAVYRELVHKLQEIEPGLTIEFSADQSENELIITAHGDMDFFPAARAAVAQAPHMDGWTIHALKPQLGLPEITYWEGVEVKTDKVLFEPLQNADSQFGLRFYVPGLKQADVDAAHNALLMALDHALGEERFAEGVQFSEVLPMPKSFKSKSRIPLRGLEPYMAWRDRRRKGGA